MQPLASEPLGHVQYEGNYLFAKVESFPAKLNLSNLSDLEFDTSASERSSGRGPVTLTVASTPTRLCLVVAPSALVGADARTLHSVISHYRFSINAIR